MPQSSSRRGFTLIETIVALLIFCVGALALAGTAALIGRDLNIDDARERATRIATSRVERLRASCHAATSGSELVGSVRSEWAVAAGDSSRLSVTESVSYVGWKGLRTDTYRAVVTCG